MDLDSSVEKCEDFRHWANISYSRWYFVKLDLRLFNIFPRVNICKQGHILCSDGSTDDLIQLPIDQFRHLEENTRYF